AEIVSDDFQHLERNLKQRRFCVLFEDQVDRYWPSKKRAARSKLSPNRGEGRPLFLVPTQIAPEQYSCFGEGQRSLILVAHIRTGSRFNRVAFSKALFELRNSLIELALCTNQEE